MTTAIAKTSKAVKGITSTVRRHLDEFERAREIYLATIKRAESEYFDRIKRATEMAIGDAKAPEVTSEAPPAAPAA